MFEWKPQFSVGIPEIDAQHRNLFAIAHELHQAMTAGQGKTLLAGILQRLIQYTVTHFSDEERMLERHAYPGLPQQRAEHEALTRQVKRFQADFLAGKVALTVHIMQFLKTWLEGHIQNGDKAYAPFVKSGAAA